MATWLCCLFVNFLRSITSARASAELLEEINAHNIKSIPDRGQRPMMRQMGATEMGDFVFVLSSGRRRMISPPSGWRSSREQRTTVQTQLQSRYQRMLLCRFCQIKYRSIYCPSAGNLLPFSKPEKSPCAIASFVALISDTISSRRRPAQTKGGAQTTQTTRTPRREPGRQGSTLRKRKNLLVSGAHRPFHKTSALHEPAGRGNRETERSAGRRERGRLVAVSPASA